MLAIQSRKLIYLLAALLVLVAAASLVATGTFHVGNTNPASVQVLAGGGMWLG